jgi:hypothetical protein
MADPRMMLEWAEILDAAFVGVEEAAEPVPVPL